MKRTMSLPTRRCLLGFLDTRHLSSKVKGTLAHGITPLHRASFGFSGDLETAQTLISAGANVNAVNSNGASPLHIAALRCHALVPALLAAGAHVNARDNKRRTPLHWAASSENALSTRLLLAAGGDVHATDDAGQTACHLAAPGDALDIVDALIQAGADVNALDHTGCSPLYLAEWASAPCQGMEVPSPTAAQIRVMQRLIQAGAKSINTSD